MPFQWSCFVGSSSQSVSSSSSQSVVVSQSVSQLLVCCRRGRGGGARLRRKKMRWQGTAPPVPAASNMAKRNHPPLSLSLGRAARLPASQTSKGNGRAPHRPPQRRYFLLKYFQLSRHKRRRIMRGVAKSSKGGERRAVNLDSRRPRSFLRLKFTLI